MRIIRLLAWTSLALFVPALHAQDATKPTGPASALAAFKVAVEGGDVKALAAVTAGEAGTALRRLADPHAKAKEASDRLDRLLRERPELGFKNPFAAGLQPLADLQCDILEPGTPTGTGGSSTQARLRFGPRAKAQEEVVFVRNEQGAWRVDLPGALAKQLKPFATAEHLDRQIKGLEKLNELLDTLGKEVQSGTLKTKETTMLRLVGLVEEHRLGELLK